REKIKENFLKNKMESSFITLGVSSFPQKLRLHATKRLRAVVSINDIYIGLETRRFKRIPYKTNIKILFSENKIDTSQTVDISKGGICFIGKRLLKTDSRVKISLNLPKNKGLINANARVAWIKKMERLKGEGFNRYKVGLEFINLENKYKRIISGELKL
ncbi:PilZ domain-containing protein, partial [Candidatus Omnitrophota bacterium]